MTTVAPITSSRVNVSVPTAAVWNGGRPQVGPRAVRAVRPLQAVATRTEHRVHGKERGDAKTYLVATLFGLLLGGGFLLNETVFQEDTVGSVPSYSASFTVQGN